MLNVSQLFKIYQKVPTRLREYFFDRLFYITGYKKHIYHKKKINDFYLKHYSSADTINSQNFIKTVIAVYYGKGKPESLLPSLDINHAESWVPFCKDRTHVFIHNFFEKNYGIRGPILFRFVILKDDNIYSVKNKILNGTSVLFTDDLIDNVVSETVPEHGVLLVQAFHPRIKTPTNALRFYGMYTNSQSEITCGVHSLTTPIKGLARDMRVGFRSYGAPNQTYGYSFQPSNVPLRALESTDSKSLLKKMKSDQALYGGNFFFQRDQQGEPVSVWHDGPVNHVTPMADHPIHLGAIQTVFLVPNFQVHAPLLRISTPRIGFQVASLSITAVDTEGKELSSKKVFIGSDESEIDLAILFSDSQLQGHIGFIVDFKRDAGEFVSVPEAHIDVYYRSRSGFSDQVHTDHTFGRALGHPKLRRGFRCRKFAPLIKSDHFEFIYSIVKTGSEGFIDDDFIYVRIITDTGAERRFKKNLSKQGLMSLSGNWLLEQMGQDIKQTAVVQYEHETINYVGSWYLINHANGQLAVDHFTGG